MHARIEVVKLIVFSMIEIGKGFVMAALIGAVVICPLEIIPDISFSAFKGLVDAAKLGIAILITGSVGLVRPEISIICYQKLALLRPKNALVESIITRQWVYVPLTTMTAALLHGVMTRFGDRVNPRFAVGTISILAYSILWMRVTQVYETAARSVSPIASAWDGPPSLVSCAENIRWLRGPQQGLFKQSLRARIEVVKLIAVSLIEIGRRFINKNLVDAAKLGIAILISGSVGLVRPEISVICYQQLALIRPKRTLGEIAKKLALMSPVAFAVAAAANPQVTILTVINWRMQILSSCIYTSIVVCALRFFAPRSLFEPDYLRPFRRSALSFRIPELNDNPIAILQQVDRFCNRPLSRIIFIESNGTVSPGLDGGGLIRTFYSRLFSSLIAKGTVAAHELHQIPGTAGGQLNFTSSENDTAMPYLAANDNGRALKMNGFQTVGKLMARCKLERFTIGQLFSPNLYRMLCSFTTEELTNEQEIPDSIRTRLVQLAHSNQSDEVKRYFGLLQRDEVTAEEYAQLLMLAEQYIEGDMPGDRTAMTPLNLAWVKKTILDHSDHAVLPALWIAKGMYQILGDRAWNALKVAGPGEMQDDIEGSLDNGVVKAKMRFEGTYHTATHDFAVTWVDTASKAQLKQFVFFTTGSNSLGKAENIFLRLYRPMFRRGYCKPLPRANTCSKQISIPTVYESQAEFNQKLKLALDSHPVISSESGFEHA